MQRLPNGSRLHLRGWITYVEVISMPGSLEEHWSAALRHERNQDYPAARRQCEAILALDAEFVPAHLRLSHYAQVDNEYNVARAHALRAADAIRTTGDYRRLSYVTLRLLDFSESGEVASLILSADWSNPVVLRQSPPLAQHLWLAGRYTDTLRFLESVHRQLPPHPLLRYTQGNVLRYLGRLDEASECYLQSLDLDSMLADAHWAMATLPGQPSATWLSKLSAARQRDPSSARLAYAAFHAFDRVGETSAAWDALAQGMRIMRARVRYDSAEEASRLRRHMSMEWIVDAPTSPSRSQPLPVFIVGMPRTGTTILDRILGNHGWITSVGERNYLSAAASEVSGRFFMSLIDTDEAVWNAEDAKAVGHGYRQRLRLLAPATALAIDKNPKNLFNVPLILKALPEAKVLIMQRDPMDAAFSNLKELFHGQSYPHSYDLSDVASHVTAVSDWSCFWIAQAPHAVRRVVYEDLVRQPDAVTEELCDFLSVPRGTGLGDLQVNKSPVATASSAQVREPIHTRGIGAWHRYARELQPLVALLQDL